MRQSESPTRVVGITGGIGCGKSEVMEYLERRYGAVCIRADEVARRLQRSDGRCFPAILHLFGEDVLAPDGELDRRRIAERVFSDEEMLRKLERIVHPAVKEEIGETVARARERGGLRLFIEAALLLEDHYEELCDEIWVIRADEEVRRLRLKRSRGYTDERITEIMEQQLSEEEFRARGDVEIDNSGDIADLHAQIDIYMAEDA